MEILLLLAISTFHNVRNVFCKYYTETVELEVLETMFWKQWFGPYGNMLKAQEETCSSSKDRKMFIAVHSNNVKEIIVALSNRDGFIGNQDIFLKKKDIKSYLSVFGVRLTEARTLVRVVPWKINFYAMHSQFRFTIEEYAILMTKPLLENNNQTNETIFLLVIPSYDENLQLLGYYILGRHASLPDPNLYGEGIVAFAHYETKSIYHVSEKLSENCVINWQRPEIHFTNKRDHVGKQREIQLEVSAKEGLGQMTVLPNIRFLKENYDQSSHQSFSLKGSEAGSSASSSLEKKPDSRLAAFGAEKHDLQQPYYTETVELEDLEIMFWKQWFGTLGNMRKVQEQVYSTPDGQRRFIIYHSYNVNEILKTLSNGDGFIGNRDIFFNSEDIKDFFNSYDFNFDEYYSNLKFAPLEINFYAMHSKFRFTIRENAIIMEKPFHEKDDPDRIYLAIIPSYGEELQLLGYYMLGRHASLQNPSHDGEGIVAFAHYDTKSIYHVSKKLSESCVASRKRPEVYFVSKGDCVSKQREIQRELLWKEASEGKKEVSPNVRFLIEKYGPNASKLKMRANSGVGTSSREGDRKHASGLSSIASLHRKSSSPLGIAISSPKTPKITVTDHSNIKKCSTLLIVCCLLVGYYLLKGNKRK